MGWEVQAEGLHRLLVRLRDDYAPPPIYVTETGAAYADVVEDGAVHDPERVAFMEAYLRAVHGAIEDGVDVGGVFWWSFLDNFEWAYGYGKRFGHRARRLRHPGPHAQVQRPRTSPGSRTPGCSPPPEQPGSRA